MVANNDNIHKTFPFSSFTYPENEYPVAVGELPRSAGAEEVSFCEPDAESTLKSGTWANDLR